MRTLFISLLSGVIFGVGLAISGMTQPTKVIGFLDILGDWDPSLAFVMMGALAVNIAGLFAIRALKKPVLSPTFELPNKQRIDLRLVGGAALFGVGWGVGGFCPGPALTAVSTALPGVLVFNVAMLVGILAWRLSPAAKRGAGA